MGERGEGRGELQCSPFLLFFLFLWGINCLKPKSTASLIPLSSLIPAALSVAYMTGRAEGGGGGVHTRRCWSSAQVFIHSTQGKILLPLPSNNRCMGRPSQASRGLCWGKPYCCQPIMALLDWQPPPHTTFCCKDGEEIIHLGGGGPSPLFICKDPT